MVQGEMLWIYLPHVLVEFKQEIAFGELWYRPDVIENRPAYIRLGVGRLDHVMGKTDN